MRRISTVALGLVLLTGCATFSRSADAHDVIEASGSPLILEVAYDDSTETLAVGLVDQATDADARRVWCEIILPAGADPEQTYIWGLGVSSNAERAPSECP